jgi:hypothetical protein
MTSSDEIRALEHRLGFRSDTGGDLTSRSATRPQGLVALLGQGLLGRRRAGGISHCGLREPWAESILASPLERHTPDTLVLPHALTANLDKVRDRGHAVEEGEYQEGVRAVAAPVFVGTEAVAAVSVSGQKLAIHDAVAHVAKTAQQLGLDLARGNAG